jgi:hypothetical protein
VRQMQVRGMSAAASCLAGSRLFLLCFQRGASSSSSGPNPTLPSFANDPTTQHGDGLQPGAALPRRTPNDLPGSALDVGGLFRGRVAGRHWQRLQRSAGAKRMHAGAPRSGGPLRLLGRRRQASAERPRRRGLRSSRSSPDEAQYGGADVGGQGRPGSYDLGQIVFCTNCTGLCTAL